MAFRLAQIVLVVGVAFFLSLVALNNLTDYGSNFQYVQHVLLMDTTFPENRLTWRAITTPAVHHLFYWILILWEVTSASLCWSGALRLWRRRSANSDVFQQAKNIAVCGLALSMLQWLVASLAVGGEWFLRWQSPTWNGQDAALRPFVVIGIVLLFVSPAWDSSHH